MRAIAVANQKGGTGKTTTAREIAALLARGGSPTVVVDLDGQHDLTNFYLEDERPGATVMDVLDGTAPALDAAVPTGRENLDLLPADDRAYSLPARTVGAGAFRSLMDELGERYAYAVVDFPRVAAPSTLAALAACDRVVVTTEASRASVEAMGATLDALAGLDGAPEASVLVTRHRRTKIADEYLALIEQMAAERGARVHRSRISLGVAVPEAEGYGLTLAEHRPKSRPAEDYRAFLLELLGDMASG